jgi:hypothetical protein
MKILARCKQSGLYLAESERWVGESDRAAGFHSIAEAELAVRRANLKGMEVILSYDEPVCELRVALGAW